MSDNWRCPGCGQVSEDPRDHVADCVLVDGAGQAKPDVATVDMKPGGTYSVPWHLSEHYVRWGRAEVTIPEDLDLSAADFPETLDEWLVEQLTELVSSNGAGEEGSKTKQWDLDVDTSERTVEADR